MLNIYLLFYLTKMPRRNQKYSKDDFERDLDELARLIEEQNGGEENNNRRNNNRRNDDDEDDEDNQEEQNGGRRSRNNRQHNNRRHNDDDEDDDDDDEDNQNGGRRRNHRRRDDDDEDNQNGGRRRNHRRRDDDDDEYEGGGKHEKSHRTFAVVEVDGKDVKARGVYRIKTTDTPLKAAERAYAQLFRKGKGKTTHEFKIRETSRYAGDKKVYGPYVGKSKKLDTPKTVKRGSTTIKIEWEHHVELK